MTNDSETSRRAALLRLAGWAAAGAGAGLVGFDAYGLRLGVADADAARRRGAKKRGAKHRARPSNLPDPMPYGHVNGVAKLPPWDGATSTDSPPGQMRMFRGNRLHDYTGSGKLGTDLEVKWKFRMADFATLKHGKPTVWRGTGWTGQTLKVGDYVFVGSTGGHFHCFEAETGKLVWVYTAQRCFKGSPCFYNNRIYVPNVDNHIRCIDAATGRLLWKWRGPSDNDSSPLVSDGVLYTGGEDGSVKAFDPDSGRLLWRLPFGVGEGEKPGSGGIESSLAVVGKTAYFGHLDGHVRAVDLETRKLVWATKIGGDTDASPLVVGDRLYIGCQDESPSFFCLDRGTGKILWSSAIRGGVWSSAAHVGGRIVVGGQDSAMHCLDANDGHELWRHPVGAPIWASPAVVDGKVVFGSYDPYLRMVDLNDGKLLWRYDFKERSHSAPAVEGGRIWVGSSSGWYYCFG